MLFAGQAISALSLAWGLGSPSADPGASLGPAGSGSQTQRTMMRSGGVCTVLSRKHPSTTGKDPRSGAGSSLYGSCVVRVLRGVEGLGGGEKRHPPPLHPHPAPPKAGILWAPLSLRPSPHLCRIAECLPWSVSALWRSFTGRSWPGYPSGMECSGQVVAER